MQHDLLQKKIVLTFCVKNGRIFAWMVFYASFPLIWYATWISENIELFTPPNRSRVCVRAKYLLACYMYTSFPLIWYATCHILNKIIYLSLCYPFGGDIFETGTIWTIIKDNHMRIIPAKFGQNPAYSIGDVLWSNCWLGTTHARHPIITIAHHEQMAQVS